VVVEVVVEAVFDVVDAFVVDELGRTVFVGRELVVAVFVVAVFVKGEFVFEELAVVAVLVVKELAEAVFEVGRLAVPVFVVEELGFIAVFVFKALVGEVEVDESLGVMFLGAVFAVEKLTVPVFVVGVFPEAVLVVPVEDICGAAVEILDVLIAPVEVDADVAILFAPETSEFKVDEESEL